MQSAVLFACAGGRAVNIVFIFALQFADPLMLMWVVCTDATDDDDDDDDGDDANDDYTTMLIEFFKNGWNYCRGYVRCRARHDCRGIL